MELLHCNLLLCFRGLWSYFIVICYYVSGDCGVASLLLLLCFRGLWSCFIVTCYYVSGDCGVASLLFAIMFQGTVELLHCYLLLCFRGLWSCFIVICYYVSGDCGVASLLFAIVFQGTVELLHCYLPLCFRGDGIAVIVPLLSPVMFQGAVEPMQVDAQPEENENVEQEQYIVENTSVVGCSIYYLTHSCP